MADRTSPCISVCSQRCPQRPCRPPAHSGRQPLPRPGRSPQGWARPPLGWRHCTAPPSAETLLGHPSHAPANVHGRGQTELGSRQQTPEKTHHSSGARSAWRVCPRPPPPLLVLPRHPLLEALRSRCKIASRPPGSPCKRHRERTHGSGRLLKKAWTPGLPSPRETAPGAGSGSARRQRAPAWSSPTQAARRSAPAWPAASALCRIRLRSSVCCGRARPCTTNRAVRTAMQTQGQASGPRAQCACSATWSPAGCRPVPPLHPCHQQENAVAWGRQARRTARRPRPQCPEPSPPAWRARKAAPRAPAAGPRPRSRACPPLRCSRRTGPPA
mmetsp:Transcript_96752/g.312424  ORF Transcript_96752/g.312424 Transcript_96752/m.312424 type:complete len:329 (-) Transcript_96752:732-1718(-)